MDIKKTLIAFSFVFAPAAMSAPIIKAQATHGGTWITITDNGVPVSSAIVNESYMTDETGRAFVYSTKEFAHTARFIALTPDGTELTTKVYRQNESNK